MVVVVSSDGLSVSGVSGSDGVYGRSGGSSGCEGGSAGNGALYCGLCWLGDVW